MNIKKVHETKQGSITVKVGLSITAVNVKVLKLPGVGRRN